MGQDSENNNIAKNTGLMTLATIGSRVTGLLRTWAMAFALGNTLLTSSYQIAYNMPSMIYELAASGILATAFLPLYLLAKEKESRLAANDFASNILTITIVVLGLLALACSIFAPLVIETQTFTQDSGESKDLAIFFFRIFAIQILFYGVGAVITGILNAERTFLIPSLAPVVNNIVVTIVMFGFVPLSVWNSDFALWWLAIGTSFGVLCQFAVQIPALIKQGFSYRPHINLHDPMLKEALKVAAPMFLYIAGTMITFSCRNAFSLDAASNGPSTLNYAWTWYQLPYGVIAVSLSTALLTEMSDCAAKEDWQGFKHYIATGLRSTFFLILPLASLVGALAVPLLQIFQAGAFSADDASFVGNILMIWTLSLPFYAGYMYMYRVFAAMRKFLQFALIDFVLRIPQVLLYWIFCSNPSIGLAGIPISDFLFYGVMLIICICIVRNKVGSFGCKSILIVFIKTAIASIVSGIIVWLLVNYISDTFMIQSEFAIPMALLIICIGAIVGLVISFGLCKVFRVPEFSMLTSLTSKFIKRFKRS